MTPSSGNPAICSQLGVGEAWDSRIAQCKRGFIHRYYLGRLIEKVEMIHQQPAFGGVDGMTGAVRMIEVGISDVAFTALGGRLETARCAKRREVKSAPVARDAGSERKADSLCVGSFGQDPAVGVADSSALHGYGRIRFEKHGRAGLNDQRGTLGHGDVGGNVIRSGSPPTMWLCPQAVCPIR